jgi:DNA repair exonuclease SbcCD ATPase subunit
LINFHYVRWRNLLSTGNNWVRIDLDRSSDTLVVGENGSGKSTVLDALCFGLFGRPFRKISKNQLINSVNQKATEVELEFTVNNKKYRIFRGIKPNKMEIWIDGSLLNQTAKVKDYQDNLEKNILKLNFHSFTQIVILGSSTFVPFMQLPSQQRREIIEDLLDIKIFTAMNSLLKERISVNREKFLEVSKVVELEKEKLIVHQQYLNDIKTANVERVGKLKEEIRISITSIENLQENITKHNKTLDELRKRIIDENEVRDKIQDIRNIESKLEDKKKVIRKDIDFYANNDVCPTCTQDISSEIKTRKIGDKNKKLSEIEQAFAQLEEEYNTINERLCIIKEVSNNIIETTQTISDGNNQISSINKYMMKLKDDIEQEESTSHNERDEKLKIENIEKQIVIEEKNKSGVVHQKEILDIAADLLKDKGIKTQIIKQYIPVMNKLVNKYLSAMEFFVNFQLDENFNESILSRYRDKFSYQSFSEGEKMRIDLALLLTWRAIAKMKNSASTNLLILDEVFDASLDSSGCDEFLKLLGLLSEDTNVFVISHKGDILADKFRSVIKFDKIKNFSQMVA